MPIENIQERRSLSVQLAIKNISRHFTFFPTMLQEHGKIFIEFRRRIGIIN